MSNLPEVVGQFDEKEIELLKKTYAKGLSDTEVSIFLKQCQAMNLNPFAKEIYGMVIKERLVLITSISGLRKVAHASGQYIGCQIFVMYSDDETVRAARCVVKKLVGGHVAEFEAEVLFSEFNTGKNNWVSMPVVMIKKVAEAAALRMAFPALQGIYEESERDSMGAKSRVSDQTKALTDKFKESAPREVVEHPDEKEQDLPLAVVSRPAEPPGTAGDYVIKAGKHTGKAVKMISKDELSTFVAWADEQKALPPDFVEYRNMANEFLSL